MKKTLSILLATLMISSCATVGTLREGNPVLTGSSNKSANDFAVCVSDKWSSMAASVNSLPIKNGTSLSIPHPVAGNDAVLDIVSEEGGSSFKLYERLPSLTPHKVDDAVINCK